VRASTSPAATELAAILKTFRSAFIGIGVFSGLLNVLTLTGSFFMLLVYDAVIPGRSVPTLVGLAIFAGVLYTFQGLLDVLRSRVLARVGVGLDEALNARVFQILVDAPLKVRIGDDGMGPLRDLDQVRNFMSSLGPAALFDMPWLPLYLTICFIFHPLIGVTAISGALILIFLTLLTERATREPAARTAGASAARHKLAEASRRNAEALKAMGMTRPLGAAWAKANAAFLHHHTRLADVGGVYSTASKMARMVLQSTILAVGAYLVIHQEATGGIMIAGSILMGRALAPIELAISHWRPFLNARQSWRRLEALLAANARDADQKLALPAPRERLSVEAVAILPPGAKNLAVQEASFSLERGTGLGIIGPSASGKSSLARALVGVWQPVRGAVRLDGATLDQYPPHLLGGQVGYLPQDVELFDGTIAQNIARFDTDAKPDAVVHAARAAGVHEMIVRMPEGYETQIGESGSILSGGQRQRIALARALYGDPFLIVLDEPNSNLDTEGEDALTHAILSARARGAIVVIIAHRPSALAGVDKVLFMNNGVAGPFGSKEEVLKKVLRAPSPVPAGGSARRVAEQTA
jgi:ATP-binding cassette subfamily C protein